MTGTKVKSRIGGCFMPAANSSPASARLLSEALLLFPATRSPFQLSDVSGCDGEARDAIAWLFETKSWMELAVSSQLSCPRDSSADLGDITRCISRDGLLFYLPGFLLHFLGAGTYKSCIWGPTFYFNFIDRLQPDNKIVQELGDPDSYFLLSKEQKRFCNSCLQSILDVHGDPYAQYIECGFEYSDLKRFSLRRAISAYWS